VVTDLLASFLDGPLQLVGFLRRKTSEDPAESRLALLLADAPEPVNEIGDYFQLGWRRG
jgi:hypothetical protein